MSDEMNEKTFTFMARSATDPDKMAMFTLQNGSVSIDLGSTLVDQAGDAYAAIRDEEVEGDLSTWINPAVTGALQKLVKPIPLGDFNAEMKGDALQATAWIRTAGLRLAPVMMTWDDVDNPEGAKAFVDELDSRKQTIDKDESLLAPLDYWASWVAIGFVALLFPILFIRKWKQRSA